MVRAIAGGLAGAALLVVGAPVRADGSNQFWPELNAFLKMDERSRLYLYTTATFAKPSPGPDGAFGIQDGEVGAHVDYSLTPVLRAQLRDEDWQRNRYLWLRAGYNYARSLGDAEQNGRFRENRGVFEVNGRTSPLAGGLEIVGRARVDLRDRSGEDSRRYRLRIGVERNFDVDGRAVIPYVEAENFFDSRYDSWSQQRYKAGAEVELSRGWRIEPYLALQKNDRSEPSTVRALGLALKFYK